MADSLVLTGVKDVKKHTGSEMKLARPKRGGDTHSLKEWWKAGAGKCYAECTVFNVTTPNGTVKLAIDSNMSTNLRIDHDGAFGFTFYGINEVRRAALFTESLQLIEHYVFPAISGGKVMTVTPANGAPKPGGTPPTPTIDTVTVDGADAAQVGEEKTYTVSYTNTGDLGTVSYQWGTAGGTMVGDTTDTVRVTFNSAGPNTVVACTVSSDVDGVDDVDGFINVNVTEVPTSIGNVTVSGEASPSDGTQETYSVAIDGDAGNLTYEWSANGAGAAINGSNSGATATFDMSTGGAVIICAVSSSDGGVTDSPQTGQISVTVT